MIKNYQFQDQHIKIECESIEQSGKNLIIFGKRVSIRIPFKINEYYQHGWQSWSLTSWIKPDKYPGKSSPKSLQVLQTDLPYSELDHPNGSWLGAVSNNENKILFLGSLDLNAHVEILENDLVGTNETLSGKWFLSFGDEKEVFTNYTILLESELGKSKINTSPKVWCSWYSFYEEIREDYIMNVCEDLVNYPFDVIQIDDGWQNKVGDWIPNKKFPSGMGALADKIHQMGKKPGLWLAPLLVVPSSELFKNHNDWLLKSKNGSLVNAGFNWNEELFALDTTNPEVLDWLKKLMETVRNWGYDYIKLDFLYAGALNGVRYEDIPRETAFRLGLKTLREATGDAFLLTCGTPILPSIGLCDAMRIGPDVFGEWTPFIENRLLNNYAVPGAQNAIRTSLNRLWLKPLVQTDPDVVYFQGKGNYLSSDQKNLLQALAEISNYKATSEIPHLNTPDEKRELLNFLLDYPLVKKISRYKYQVGNRYYDFTDTMTLLSDLTIFETFLQWFVNGLSKFKFVLIIFGKINSFQRKQTIKKIFQSK